MEAKSQLKEELKSYEMELIYMVLDDGYIIRMKKSLTVVKQKNGNASYIDLALGKPLILIVMIVVCWNLKIYTRWVPPWGLWINGSRGFGKNIFV